MDMRSNQPAGSVEVGGEAIGLRQLIVIGNGFDLACGLRSSYGNFFSERLRFVNSVRRLEESEWRKAVDEEVAAERLTIWDLILGMGSGPDWCNVEAAIARWVLPPRESEEDEPISERFMRLIDKHPFSHSPKYLGQGIRLTEFDEVDNLLLEVSKYVWHRMGYQPDRGMDRHKLLALLRGELAVLEGQFRDYLRGQCENNSAYLDAAVANLSDIAWSDRKWSDAVMDATSVLSFNYTRPFDFSNRVVSEDGVVNIHGDLDGETIFGVDGKDCMDDLDALPFTKTYRVASLGVRMPRRLYATGSQDGSSLGVIKFFGHSLGEADYSYFQAIFDGVDLYGGDTRLVFFYRAWEGKDEEELHAETVSAVSALLSTYGKTMDNMDHGKNLMHKLLLENRLEIRRLEKWSASW